MIKLRLKSLIAQTAYKSSLLDGMAYLRLRGRAFVLMYHRVIRKVSEEAFFIQPGMYLSADTFRDQAMFLKERFHVLPLDELVQRIKTGRSVGGCCAITFDDGWHDNFTCAFPVLQEFQLPTTIFLATGFIGTKRFFWPEEITYYLRQPVVRASAKQGKVLDRFLSNIPESSKEETFLDNAVQTLKTFSPEEREEVLEHLRSASITPPPGRLLMNWEEAKQMQATGLVSFGAHTSNHVILDQVSQPQAEEEIVRSQQELESRLGVRPEFFAYPNGNFTSDLKTILKRNGFRGAVTTRKGWVDKGVPLFEIPRIGMHEDVSRTIPLFLARILLNKF